MLEATLILFHAVEQAAPATFTATPLLTRTMPRPISPRFAG